jgi:two-component system, chemotaxis family, chemotaxis protein CheY
MEKTVLVVDDAAFMRATLRDIFGRNGYQVVGEARNGIEAVARYATLNPALVTMDIVMPELSGIEAVKRIIAGHPSARIIMCSAMGQQALVSEAIMAGARDFVIKPFQASKVLDAAARALEQ